MKIGLIGLGKMGRNLALNIAGHGHEVVAYNRTREKTDELVREEKKIKGAYSIEELKSMLSPPRIVWLMVSAGAPTEEMVGELSRVLEKGDIIIDGGNSFYKDSIRRYGELKEREIHFLDIGTSGGISGARNGACYMAGGDVAAYNAIEPVLRDTAVKGGYGHVGPAGSGHFVKMIHNGIEYGMMESIGEGFEILKRYNPEFDFGSISKIWSNGSIISGHLMSLSARMFSNDPLLDDVESKIGQSGEGLWTLKAALELNVAAPAISASVFKRFETHEPSDFSSKVIQGLRKEFGGHDTKNRL